MTEAEKKRLKEQREDDILETILNGLRNAVRTRPPAVKETPVEDRKDC